MTATAHRYLAERAPFHLDVEDLEPGALRVMSFQGREVMNERYSFEVLVVALHTDERVVEDTLGRPATLWVEGIEVLPQLVHGAIAGISREGWRDGMRPVFRILLVPRLALLERRVTSRIYQDMTVREIVDEVLTAHAVRRTWELARPLSKRVYCVQYHESDLAFVRRMLAEEGIFYRFDHPEVDPQSSLSREIMVLGDVAETAAPVAGLDRLPLRDSVDGQHLLTDSAHLSQFRPRRVHSHCQVLLRDYDFVRPRFEQRSLSNPLLRSAPPTLDGRYPAAAGVYEHKLEYEEPGLRPEEAARYLEQLRAEAVVHEGESRCPRLRPGRSFELTESDPRTEGRYTVTRVDHEGQTAEVATEADAPLYRNRFACVRAEVPFRPPRPVRGLRQVTETAMVVGPAGEEIYADVHGRVKVQFHWDLEGKSDERSSCWLRVSQPWAGPGWGFQFIPRIGMEVVVTFLGGDLDRPIITGAVYNALNAPSFPIPVDVTRSGIRTRSTPGGEGFNELSFDDAKSAEQVYLRAERNLDEAVMLDHSTQVGRHQSIHVGANQSTVVLGAQSVTATASRSVYVEGNHQVESKADRSDTVDGDHTESIGGNSSRRVVGTRNETVGGDSLTVVHGTHGETFLGPSSRQIGSVEEPASGETYAHGDYLVAAAGTVRIRGDQAVVLECGDSVIELRPEGIRLRGRDIRTIATELASMQSSGPAVVATKELELSANSVHIFGETSRLSLTKEATLTSDEKTVITGSGAGLGLAGSATLAGGKVVVASEGATLVLDAEAKLDGAMVKLNCGGEGGGVSAEERDPKVLVTPIVVETQDILIRVLDSQREPIRGKKYVLTVGGERREKMTSAEGEVKETLPNTAAVGELTVWPDTFPEGPRLRWKLDIRPKLPEAKTVPGARIRLANLAYYEGPPIREIDDRLRTSIRRFQTDYSLEVTGALDAATVYMLTKVHGH